MTTYTITSTHTFEYTVEADSPDEAEQLGYALPDNPMRYWQSCESVEAEED
jgi:hypothetical protein